MQTLRFQLQCLSNFRVKLDTPELVPQPFWGFLFVHTAKDLYHGTNPTAYCIVSWPSEPAQPSP
jgi:hypothetical protein